MESSSKHSVPEELKERESTFMKGYDLLDSLGLGGYGAVYKVKSWKDGRFYAYKESRYEQDSLETKLKEYEEMEIQTG